MIKNPNDENLNPFWLQSETDLLLSLNVTKAGLTNYEAAKRLITSGPNTLHQTNKSAIFFQIISKFLNPLVMILLFASAISAMTGDILNFVIISLIILMSVTLDFVQEYRAGKAALKLRQLVTVHVLALRDGTPQEIPHSSVVPGDIVILEAGDMIPGDARVLESKDFFVNQALLTGEPFPVEKIASNASGTQEMLDSVNCVFMGSSALSGHAKVLICRTGIHTAFGEISESLTSKPPPTAFQEGIVKFGFLIMRLTVFLVLFVLLVNAYFLRDWLQSFLFAVALAVGLTPELLPMIISVTLSKGAQRMAAHRVIVKQLASIQNLGSMDVLCTDKTGTLTEAKIRLEKHIDFLGRDSKRVLELAYINSFFETGLKSTLDDAILEHNEIDVSSFHKIDEVPFDFERRRISVLVDNGKKRTLIVKGAPEDVLKLCTSYELENELNKILLDETSLSVLQELFNSLGREGFRVLAIAVKDVDSSVLQATLGDEAMFTFAGFAAFLDPPKESAKKALADLSASGISIKILTGDNELVTQNICDKLGLKVQGILKGSEIEKMDDQTLFQNLETVNLFCRVNPTQKNRIILSLKKRGHTVGYLGDGINDAPSLHTADIGISVDTAADVAKDAADMILLDKDLGVLQKGVIEGRRTFSNIMKYIMMGTSSNFGNMFSMAGGALFLPFLPMLPTQILLNNMLYDISEIAIPLDNVDAEDLLRPRPWDVAFVRKFMLVVGPISSIFDFLTFYMMIAIFNAQESLFHTGWFIESMATQVLVIFIIRTRKNPFKSRPNFWLGLGSLLALSLAVFLPFSPLSGLLGFTPPPPLFFLMLAGMVILYLFIVEVVKQWFYKHFFSR